MLARGPGAPLHRHAETDAALLEFNAQFPRMCRPGLGDLALERRGLPEEFDFRRYGARIPQE